MNFSVNLKGDLDRVKEQIRTIDRYRLLDGYIPKLAIITVGNNPASEVYVRNKIKDLRECDMDAVHFELDADVSKERIMNVIEILNADRTVDGVMVQMPLPSKFTKKDTTEIINMINPRKDVDGLTYYNTLAIYNGYEPFFYPCTPYGIMQHIRGWLPTLRWKNVVIVGRSDIVGKPLAHMLMNRGATVTICHKSTADLGAVTRTADILIVAAGHPGLITEDMISREHDVYIYDVGINYVKGKMVGDVDIKTHTLADMEAEMRAGNSKAFDHKVIVTQVPGGVGQLTRAALLKQLSNRTINTHGKQGVSVDEWIY